MSLTVKTDDVTRGRKDVNPHGRFRGEWVNINQGGGMWQGLKTKPFNQKPRTPALNLTTVSSGVKIEVTDQSRFLGN